MNHPKVSVIIPTYNRADLLPRTIESVLNQTFRNFELIVVDDGSTDNTREVVKKFEEKDLRVKYIWQENSGGPARPMNVGLKISQGEYIAFLEDDDEWLPEKLQRQLEVFQNSKKENLGFVGCNVLIVNKERKTTKIYNMSEHDDEKLLEKLLIGFFFFNFSMLVIKREVIDKIGFLDEKLELAVDQDICLRIAQKHNFNFVPTPLIKYHIHGENISRISSYNKQLTEWLYMVSKHKDLYKRYPKIYSNKLKNLGTLYMLSGNPRQARQYFLRAITVYPINFRLYVNFLLSFLGKKGYLTLLNLKKKDDM